MEELLHTAAESPIVPIDGKCSVDNESDRQSNVATSADTPTFFISGCMVADWVTCQRHEGSRICSGSQANGATPRS